LDGKLTLITSQEDAAAKEVCGTQLRGRSSRPTEFSQVIAAIQRMKAMDIDAMLKILNEG
jgi:hypothetical protein